jgi:outer membrane usher protein
VAPHAGAVVMLKFKTENGRSVIIRVRQADGQSVPFGADVVDEQNKSIGVVGQAGRILARGVKDTGKLTVQWTAEDSTSMRCSFPYALPAPVKGQADSYEKIEATCTPAPSTESSS